MEKEKQQKPVDEEPNRMSKVFYFTGMGFRMIAIIGLFTFIGYKVDEKQSNETPLFTAGFSLVGVGIALYTVIKEVVRK